MHGLSTGPAPAFASDVQPRLEKTGLQSTHVRGAVMPMLIRNNGTIQMRAPPRATFCGLSTSKSLGAAMRSSISDSLD